MSDVTTDSREGGQDGTRPVSFPGLSEKAGLANYRPPLNEVAHKLLTDVGLENSAISGTASQVRALLPSMAWNAPSFFEDAQPIIPNLDHPYRDIEFSPVLKPRWHQLIILGNGFDLQCGLRSRFQDFFEPRLAAINRISKYDRASWREILNGNDLTLWDFALKDSMSETWCDIEGVIEEWVLSHAEASSASSLFWSALEAIGRPDLFDDDISHINYVDPPDGSRRLKGEEDDRAHLLANVARYSLISCPELAGEGDNPKTLIGLFKSDLRRLERAFADYLSIEVKGNDHYSGRCGELYRLIDEDKKPSEEDTAVSTSVLSFNYTNVVENYFDKGEEGVFANIHGRLGEEIIFGIDGKDHMDDPDAAPFTKTYRLMLHGGSRTDKLIRTASSSKLQNATDVIKFYGHSLGRADYSYFQSIFDGVDLYESQTTLVFYYPLDDSNEGAPANNKLGLQLAENVNKLLTVYGTTMNNKEHGKNLMHKLLLEGRLIIRGIRVD